MAVKFSTIFLSNPAIRSEYLHILAVLSYICLNHFHIKIDLIYSLKVYILNARHAIQMHETSIIPRHCVYSPILKTKFTVWQKNEFPRLKLHIGHSLAKNDAHYRSYEFAWLICEGFVKETLFLSKMKWLSLPLKWYLFSKTLGVVVFGFDPSSVGATFYSLST